MIKANEARARATESAIFLKRKEIESNIKKNIEKGRTQCTFSGVLPQEIIDELEANGYTVTNGQIKW